MTKKIEVDEEYLLHELDMTRDEFHQKLRQCDPKKVQRLKNLATLIAFLLGEREDLKKGGNGECTVS